VGGFNAGLLEYRAPAGSLSTDPQTDGRSLADGRQVSVVQGAALCGRLILAENG
jgi:hypothetical protein